jgi:hypothetical protein
MASDERLGTLIDSLDLHDNRDTVGIFYVFWGVMNVLGVWIFTLVWSSAAFWVVWIPCGVVIMMAMLQVKFRREGRVLFKAMTIPYIWVALLAVLPLLIWVFPEVLHLYPLSRVFSLTAAWVTMGIYATGAYLGRPVIAWGSLAFGLAAVLFFLLPEYDPWIFTGANTLGLIVPGLVSHLEERR